MNLRKLAAASSRTSDKNAKRVLRALDIYADDFCEFVKRHGRDVLGRRLTYDALWFVRNYVFPPSHAELLSVRGTYKRHDADDDTDANTEAQTAAGSEEGA
jgi:hypothetical protein